jgi:hypothetical protein
MKGDSQSGDDQTENADRYNFLPLKRMEKLASRINRFCERSENRFGLLVTSLVLGLIILGFDMLYITPHFESAYHGLQYSLLSNAPFDFTVPNPLRYRILPSLIGYITFLRGDLFFIVPLVFALLFISSVYFVYRRKGYAPVDALLFSGLIAFSCTTYIQLAAPGYTDAVFYFFIFWAFTSIRNIPLSAVFFSLALLTHESCLFLLPVLLCYALYLNQGSNRKLLAYGIAYGISILPLLAYRHWVAAHVAVEYDLNFYFSEKNIHFAVSKVVPLLSAGLFYAFKLFWFFPAYAASLAWKKKEQRFLLLIFGILICDVLQMIIAFDITRMLCLGFPVILLAAERVKAEWEPAKFTRFALALTLANFLLMQYFVSCDGIVPMPPSPYTYVTGSPGN